MREATALVPRGEFAVPGEPETVIAGYRRDGSLSVYFGADPCLHFDPQLRLRRAFRDGDLYRTQGQTLARLQRRRSAGAVELVRHDLSASELTEFLESAAARLRGFRDALHSGTSRRIVPADADIASRLTDSLSHLLDQPLALAPHVRGKR